MFSMSLKDDLTSCLQQEPAILLLGSVQIFAVNQGILKKRVNFKAIFLVAHALPHMSGLEFCLSNLKVTFLCTKNSAKLQASTIVSAFLLRRWSFLSHSNSISWRGLRCIIKMKCCSRRQARVLTVTPRKPVWRWGHPEEKVLKVGFFSVLLWFWGMAFSEALFTTWLDNFLGTFLLGYFQVKVK